MLTLLKNRTSLTSSLPHEAIGIGILKPHGVSRFNAAFLCAKSQFFVMLDWVGSRKTGRVVCPVCQPTQFDTMIGIVLSGLKIKHTEAIMPIHNRTTKPTKTVSGNQSQSRFNVFTQSGRSIARRVPFQTAIRLKSGQPNLTIKFSGMEVQS